MFFPRKVYACDVEVIFHVDYTEGCILVHGCLRPHDLMFFISAEVRGFLITGGTAVPVFRRRNRSSYRKNDMAHAPPTSCLNGVAIPCLLDSKMIICGIANNRRPRWALSPPRRRRAWEG